MQVGEFANELMKQMYNCICPKESQTHGQTGGENTSQSLCQRFCVSRFHVEVRKRRKKRY